MVDPLEGLETFKNDPELKKKITWLIQQWQHDYPKLDILMQIRKAYRYRELNPSRAKKPKHGVFLNNWMANAEKWRVSPIQFAEMPKCDLEAQKKFEREWKPEMTFEEMQQIRRQNMGQIVIDGKNMRGSIETTETNEPDH